MNQPFIDALGVVSPMVILFILIGVALGILVGVTPGIGPPVGLALLLPLTLPLEQWEAIAALIAIYVGGMYGGAVSAIIINVPGTPGAIASTFDGYPLARQGRADFALNVSVIASAFGTFMAAVLLLVSIPLLIEVIYLFGTPEYALVAVFGLTVIPLVSQGSIVKSLLAASFGIILSTIGMAPGSATPRFWFGYQDLMSGLNFVAILLGVFAIAEMIKLSSYRGTIGDSWGGEEPGDNPDSSGETSESDSPKGENASSNEAPGGRIGILSTKLRYIRTIFINSPVTFLKATLVGLIVGFIPAAGGSVSNIIAYAEEKRSASDPETFGKGNERGLIASEAANSGTIAGSLVPVFSFGIPGSPTSAIILGGLLLHGIQPSPQLFAEKSFVSYQAFLIVAVGGVILLLVGLLTVTRMSKLTDVDVTLIIPVVTVLCFLGAYSLNFNYVDVMTVMAVGLLAYLMLKYEYSLVAFIMGVILGPIIEANVNRGLQLGGMMQFVESTTAKVLILLIILSLGIPLINWTRARYNI